MPSAAADGGRLNFTENNWRAQLNRVLCSFKFRVPSSFTNGHNSNSLNCFSKCFAGDERPSTFAHFSSQFSLMMKEIPDSTQFQLIFERNLLGAGDSSSSRSTLWISFTVFLVLHNLEPFVARNM